MNVEKIKQKLLRNCELDSNTGCWNWKKYTQNGYGRINVDGKMWRAHRVSYLLFRGEIPPETLVCHRCDNPVCINPDHLFLGTHSTNNQDMWDKGRHKKVDNRGERYGACKLSWEIVREIRDSKKTAKELAIVFNVSPSHIYLIRSGKVWKDGPNG